MMKICVMMLMGSMNIAWAMKPTTPVMPQGTIKLAGTDPKTGVQGKIEDVPFDVAWKIGVVRNPLEDLSQDTTGQIILPDQVIPLKIEPEKLEKIIDILKIQKPEELTNKINLLTSDKKTFIEITNAANVMDVPGEILTAFGNVIISKIKGDEIQWMEPGKEKLIRIFLMNMSTLH